MHLNRKATRDLLTQINAPPAHHLIRLRIRTVDNQVPQLRHLCLTQLRLRASADPRAKPRQALGIVPMNPVTQRLPLHTAHLRRFLRELPSRISATARSRRTTCPSLCFDIKRRKSAAEYAKFVTAIARVIAPPVSQSNSGQRITTHRVGGSPHESKTAAAGITPPRESLGDYSTSPALRGRSQSATTWVSVGHTARPLSGLASRDNRSRTAGAVCTPSRSSDPRARPATLRFNSDVFLYAFLAVTLTGHGLLTRACHVPLRCGSS